ncbi:16S rRNA (uracil1498-N3)-methyltransferase [Ruminococcaceae bacterium FB2012]|nr:16S rRNA (uracil1498-N3)-methyltransferase [Ruminococcaceae bacterium FB2012]
MPKFNLPRFFKESRPEGETVLTGEDARHIGLSLRMRVGEKITLCSKGVDFECEIVSITPQEVRCRVVDEKPSEGEPTVKVTLFQALPKSGKMSTIVQKAVELGVDKIVPVITSRCVARPDSRSMARKHDRWNKVALAAARQCGRGVIPEVTELVTFEEAVKQAAAMDRALFCYEGGGESLLTTSFEGAVTVGILIGAEGGFEASEAETAKEAGLVTVTLGRRILRCETAPLAAVSAVMLLTGNM